MSSPNVQDPLGQVLVDFSVKGAFPAEEALSAAYVDSSTVSAALAALDLAKAELENEVREISRDSASDVDLWIKHAKSIQDDIERSRRLASSIVRQAEADEERIEELQEKETYVEFLTKEISFNDELLTALRSLQAGNDSLDKAEELASERRIVAALLMLEGAWKRLQAVPLEKTTRALRLLDTRSLDLQMQIHEQFAGIWKALVDVKPNERTITINKELPGTPTNIHEAMTGFRAYKELDQAAKKLWEDLDEVILKPRTNLQAGSIPRIQVEKNSLSLRTEVADQTIKSLFIDLETIIQFLMENLPPDLIQPLAEKMMPPLSTRIIEVWLDTAVPASLDDMADYQKALSRVGDFASKLESLNWPGADTFNDWVTNAPKIWVSKRRDAALDWTRNQLSLGLGIPQVAERVEKQMVARDESIHVTATGTGATDNWDNAWSDDGDAASQGAESPNQDVKDSSRNRKSLEEERQVTEVFSPVPTPDADDQIDDDAEAWGWGDDDGATDIEPEDALPAAQSSAEEVVPLQRHVTPSTREMTLSEKYWTSSLPRAVFTTVEQVYADGAYLHQPENAQIPVSPAAAGLFSLPRSILALYRAVSPHYYSLQPGGNMYLYNDAMWLAERFQQFQSDWQNRPDIPRRTLAMVKIETERGVLLSFGKRAYTNELNAQRTIINDLLGGAYNFFQQEDQIPSELEDGIQAVIAHIRTTAALWDAILPYSAWASAVGSLVNAVASKLIADVFDLSDIGVDEAERTATILSRVEALDNLFIPRSDPKSSRRAKNGRSNSDLSNAVEAVPLTSQFADKWMKMKFLSEVLQSNLKDVKFLWFESDLSLYFTVDEVEDLVDLSFQKNAAVRQAIKEIRERPDPRGLRGDSGL